MLIFENISHLVRNLYRKWCAKAGFRFSAEKAVSIYAHASAQVSTLSMTDPVKCLITQAVAQLNAIIETISVIQHEMLTLASQLPEYPVVMRMFGVGPILGPQLMAEIGDVRRFHCKQSLVAFAGVDAPPCQPGAENNFLADEGICFAMIELGSRSFQVMEKVEKLL